MTFINIIPEHIYRDQIRIGFGFLIRILAEKATVKEFAWLSTWSVQP